VLKEREQILPSLMNKKGFTLIGIAIIMIILGILLTLSISIMGVSVKKTKCAKSRKIVNEAKKAIIGFTIENMRLPSTDEFPNIVRDTDAWGRKLIYIPDDATIKYNGSTSRADLTGTGTNICCGPTPIDLAVEDKTKGNFTDVAFVVLSTGENGKQDTTFSNKNIGGTLYYVATIEKPGETYDDIVEYMTLTDLRARTGSYPLYSVKNSIGNKIRVNSGDYNNECKKIDFGSSFRVRNGQKIDVYCGYACQWFSAHTTVSFDNVRNIDTNRNCNVTLNGSCSCWWIFCWWTTTPYLTDN